MTIFINRTMSGRTERADQRGVYADAPDVAVTTDLSTTAMPGGTLGGDAAAVFGAVNWLTNPGVVRRRVAASDGVPFQVSTSVFPPEVIAAAPQIAEQDTGAGGFLSRLEDAGFDLDMSASLTHAEAGDRGRSDVSTKLDVDRGEALWREVWTVKDATSGQVLAVTESFYPAHRVGFTFA
ncbi:UTRA domain-containing protein [Glycomyces sp. A-F 0318]|uniref:UTRA domain-containing protein n=1 Tax=Glycomyces amatae TaxID=2881355 RepID=UPI001E61ABB0|nr:UTRA domain-containing protein [Glycomyces amatae]MCD0446432.1 UTRA domain-containing protein [Glycomyces amatae]